MKQMESTEKLKLTKRLDLLDLFRFVAAFSVLMYHYTYSGWSEKSLITEFWFGPFWKYGYLGVQFFFIISGYVIFSSAKGKSLLSFFTSRFSRLFPAYWICVICTFGIVWLITPDQFTFFELAVNLTMLQGFVGVPHIDSVYWSLTYELIFYFWISCYLLTNRNEMHLTFFLIFFLTISTISYFLIFPNIFNVVMQTVYAPYFIAGICFSRLANSKNKVDVFLIIWCFLICIAQINEQLIGLSSIQGIEYSLYIVFTILCAMYCFFVLLDISYKIKIPKATTIGALTYPLYLIHAKIGESIFIKFGGSYNHYFLLFSCIVSVLVFSYVVNVFIENKYSYKLKKFLILHLSKCSFL